MPTDKRAGDMSETLAKFEGLLQRVRSALILLPFVIAPVIFGGWSFTLLLAIAGFLMAREWGNLLSASPREGMALGIAVVLILGFGFLLGHIRPHQGLLGKLQLIGSLLAGFFEFLVLGFRRRNFLHGVIKFLLRIRLLFVEIISYLLRFTGQFAFVRGHLGGGIGGSLGFVRRRLGRGAGLFGRLGRGVRPLERLIR